MNQGALNTFTQELSKVWGPLSSSLTFQAKSLTQDLIRNCEGEDWVSDLLKNKEPEKEVARSEEHGFLLLGHVEQKEDTSPPHDHGCGWVVYSVAQGSVEMGIFQRVVDPDGTFHLVQKDSYIVTPGQCSIYLPGDIHATRTLEDNTLMFRLTSCDFHEEVRGGRLVRYVNADYQAW